MEVASAQSFGSLSGEEPIKPLYFEQADLLFQRATLTADAKAAEEYLRYARDAIETYKAAELRDAFGSMRGRPASENREARHHRSDDCGDCSHRLSDRIEVLAKLQLRYPALFRAIPPPRI
jgi:hypothetical protein